MATATQRPPSKTCGTVVHCYDFFDRLFPECGLLDLTDGMYHGDPSTPYDQAQQNQIDWLLDEAGCRRGSRILDVGCGNGTLVETAQRRGAESVGITISPPQVRRCRARGLNVHLMDYRAIPDSWMGCFDAVVANGSAEHFVQPDDVLHHRQDAVYEEMFEIFYHLLDPASPSRRVVTTIIHFNERTPRLADDELSKGPLHFPWFSEKFHYALLQRGFGGYYPAIGQLARCAGPYFELVDEVDGTYDYYLTSEACFRRVKRSLIHWKTGPRIWARLVSHFLRHPRHCTQMCFCLFVAESWQRQFRGPIPPTTLLRQTWQRRWG